MLPTQSSFCGVLLGGSGDSTRPHDAGEAARAGKGYELVSLTLGCSMISTQMQLIWIGPQADES
jgi:hypothetical protein